MSRHSYTVNSSILLTKLPLLQRPQAARDAGFSAVEFWWPFDTAVPSDRKVDEFVRAVSDAGVTLSHLNFAAGDLAAGERGILSDPNRVAEFRDNIDVVVGIGEQLGASGFNALYGNRIDGVLPAKQDEVAAENLTLAGHAAARVGASVLLEPVSGFAAYPLKFASDAVTVIERVGSPHVGLLADLYHLAVNGENLPAAITRFSKYIRHVQIADMPGRGAPGTGELPVTQYLAQLTEIGYDGYVSLEYASSAADPFAWLRPHHNSSYPANELCPCQHGELYARCCGPLIDGAPAQTAAQLMRSRYTAFAVGATDYLLRSWHPSTRPDRLELDPQQTWRRLDIVRTVHGGPFDKDGVVEFRAHYRHLGRSDSLHEVSRFVREHGHWFYVDGQILP